MKSSLMIDLIKNSFYIFLGAIFLTIGVVCFLVPNNLITGGTAGLSLLLYQISSITIGTWMIVINVPLLLLGVKYFGKNYAVKSIISIFLTSFLIDIAKEYFQVQAITNESILASIFGGIFIGIGLGLIIKTKSSVGGTTIMAAIIASKTHYKAAEVLLFFDALIILFSLFVFFDNDRVLYSILSIYITAKVVDVILSGRITKKTVHIVTSKTKEISQEIVENFGPHGTILKGDDLSEGKDKQMILIVIEASKIQLLREIAKKHDEDSFLVIVDASELHGRGH